MVATSQLKKLTPQWAAAIAFFQDKDNKEYPTVKELVMALKQPDGKPESVQMLGHFQKGNFGQ